jgi:SAM-dependent methyltransferase
MNTSQSAFGVVAALTNDLTIRAGRYAVQKLAERRIFADLLPKLQIEPHHRVLDIGCGSGVLLIPLAQMVEKIVGLDHPDVVGALGATIRLPNVSLIGGSFPGTPVPGLFDRIVAYSVMQCNPDYSSALAFVRAAAQLLAEGGRLIVADIPNSDRRTRFRESRRGKAFEAEWAAMRAANPAADEEADAFANLAAAAALGQLSDKQILQIASELRHDGFDVWIVPQSPDLPFGNTREDMIIVRP